ncbi:MAG: ABC-F family ATPase [Methylococcales bacterium]|nr:ABC-F family ATPase [Methylococcales bacterium]
MLTTANITIQFGVKPLFENVSVKFGNGNRYGLIGANGCGKSTFIKILGGDLEATSGNVAKDPNQRIGKLNQNQFAYEDCRVIDTVIMGYEELWAIQSERDAIYANPEMTEEEGMRAGELESEYAEMDGYTAEARASELLAGLGILEAQHYGLMSQVAPGWKLRVLLAQVLFSNPDIMLLDEPTNNLDIHAIQWLEGILNERNCTMVIVSHDRHFLNSVCTHMADLDYGEIRLYPGSYDDYMTASTMVIEQLQSENAKKQVQIADLKAFVSRFSANASKSKQATSRAKKLAKIDLAEIKPSSRQNPFIRFEQSKKLHRLALEVEGLTKGYESDLLKNVNLTIEVGERVAVIGQNGVGKTTLLKCLAGDLESDSGQIKWSENSELGYCAQDHGADFATDMSLFDWMEQWRSKSDDDQAIRGTLGRLLFSQDDIHKKVSVLSGGEKGRMIFGKLMLQRTNMMLLDEPTNHLDMESIESLNLALENYPGTLIFVSHDREFVSSLATRIIEITPTEIIDFKGRYDDYLLSQ